MLNSARRYSRPSYLEVFVGRFRSVWAEGLEDLALPSVNRIADTVRQALEA